MLLDWLVVDFLDWRGLLILLIAVTALPVVIPVPLLSLSVAIVAAFLLFVIWLFLSVHLLFGLVAAEAVVLGPLPAMGVVAASTTALSSIVVVAVSSSTAWVLSVSSVAASVIIPRLLLLHGLLLDFFLHLSLSFQALLVLVARLFPVVVLFGEEVLNQQSNPLRYPRIFDVDKLVESLKYSLEVVQFFVVRFIAGIYHVLLVGVAALVHEVDCAFDGLIVRVERVFIEA